MLASLCAVSSIVALKPVIYKLTLNLSDLNRHCYQDFQLTIALHPSETLERMVARIVAFALNAHDELTFTKGLSSVDEPDIWQKTLDGQTALWIEVGEPADDRIKKATRIAQRVKVYSFNSKSAVWWQQEQGKFSNLVADIIQFDDQHIQALTKHVSRTMTWYVTISDNSVTVNSEQGENEVSWRVLQGQALQ